MEEQWKGRVTEINYEIIIKWNLNKIRICSSSIEFNHSALKSIPLEETKPFAGFAWKAKHFLFVGFLHFFLSTTFTECRGIRSKIIFYRPSNSYDSSVICSYKRKFLWSILFVNKSQRSGFAQKLLDKWSHLFICKLLK